MKWKGREKIVEVSLACDRQMMPRIRLSAFGSRVSTRDVDAFERARGALLCSVLSLSDSHTHNTGTWLDP